MTTAQARLTRLLDIRVRQPQRIGELAAARRRPLDRNETAAATKQSDQHKR